MNIVKLNNLNIKQLNQVDRENKFDLKKLDTLQLKEMIERQDKILLNKKFINSLPDKGEKLKKLKQRLEENLKNRELVIQSTSLLSKLSLGEKIVCQHPMAIKYDEASTSKLNLYSTALASAYNDNLVKLSAKRFTLNKTKTDLDNNYDNDDNYGDNVSIKNANSSVKKKYEDGALKFNNKCKPINVLSVQDSLELEKLYAMKQDQITFQRKYTKLVEHYDKKKDDSDNFDDNSVSEEFSSISDEDDV